MSILQLLILPSGRPIQMTSIWLAAAFMWLTPVTPTFSEDGASIEMSDMIVLGRVSNNPRKHYAALDAMGRYLVEHSDRIAQHETILASDNEEMTELLRTGKVHLVSESAFSSMLYERAAGARIFLRQWKGGRPSYKTLFFTRKRGDIRQIGDLAGSLIAFEDAGSTSGYFVPRATIEAHDLTMKSAEEPRSAVDVGYLFADSEVNVVAWVARSKVDAGVISDVHWEDESRAPAGLKRDLRIFHETPDIIRSVMVAGPQVDDERLEHVSEILLGMHEHADGQEVLKNFYKTSRFDRLVGDARASLDHIRSLFDRANAAPPS
ncbi:MAG: phosphate/phosphite/phosphonate ABC transporter substrate-binding protein [Geminicoccaceae bacterium]